MSATEANRQATADAVAGWPGCALRMSPITAALAGAPLADDVLCHVTYGVSTDGTTADDPRAVSVPLVHLHGGAIGECWRGGANVSSGRDAEIAWAEDGDVLMVQLAEANPAEPEAAAENLYGRLLAFIAARGYPHLLRVWNYIEDINAGEGDAERYRRFCIGRHRALAQTAGFERRLPAASAIGAQGGAQVGTGGCGLRVHAFAALRPGLQVENPRQVSAFRYPRSYGLRSPSFSRATLVPWADGAQLFVSGTASIVGHATAHAGDLLGQLRQTRQNLDVLRAHAAAIHLPGTDAHALKPEHYTVYLRHADDLPQALKGLAEHFADAPVVVLRGDICRRELLIEVEASYRLDVTA